MSAPAVIDRETLQELCEFCGEEALVALITTFAKHAPGQVADIEAALEQGNCQRISARAHTLRSGAGSLGLLRLIPLLTALEHQTDHLQPASLEPLIANLREEFELALSRLQAIRDNPAKLATIAD